MSMDDALCTRARPASAHHRSLYGIFFCPGFYHPARFPGSASCCAAGV